MNARNTYYLKLAEPKQKQIVDGDSPQPARKKNVSALKTEQLQRLFSENTRIGARFPSAVTSMNDASSRASVFSASKDKSARVMINGREMKIPDPKFQRKLGKMSHFTRSPNVSVSQ